MVNPDFLGEQGQEQIPKADQRGFSDLLSSQVDETAREFDRLASDAQRNRDVLLDAIAQMEVNSIKIEPTIEISTQRVFWHKHYSLNQFVSDFSTSSTASEESSTASEELSFSLSVFQSTPAPPTEEDPFLASLAAQIDEVNANLDQRQSEIARLGAQTEQNLAEIEEALLSL